MDSHSPDSLTADDRPRLLLIEDDPELGPMMASVLEEVYVVTLLADGHAGLAAANTGRFDVLIVDRRLPGMDGSTVAQTLRRDGISTPILLLTALGTTQDKVTGLDAGANDYLVKPFEFDELFARLRAIRRPGAAGETTHQIGAWDFFPHSRIIESPYSGQIVLTLKESELLELLSKHPLKTFSREEILASVFNAEDTTGTVDTYIHYLRKKTEPEIVITVRGRGYRLGQL
ncbi:response regulator transcription factor [Brevibacterium sp. K11IcPPYGO002]|uniref:response regulator transcription factor n=1 Tax=Brevibacterium sp. K11IcPPYGO002 TaxID=3058837 RepID=UPI003D818A9F